MRSVGIDAIFLEVMKISKCKVALRLYFTGHNNDSPPVADIQFPPISLPIVEIEVLIAFQNKK